MRCQRWSVYALAGCGRVGSTSLVSLVDSMTCGFQPSAAGMLACATTLPSGQLSSVHRSRRNTTYCRITSAEPAPLPPVPACSPAWVESAEVAAVTEAGGAADALPLINLRCACRSCCVLQRRTAGAASGNRADLQDRRGLQRPGTAALGGRRGCTATKGASAP